MFLDDKLYNICNEFSINTSNDVQRLNIMICKECENYYKSKINLQMTKTEVKALLNRTFNLWDSFVNNLEKSKIHKLKILSILFSGFTFKKQFLQNKEMNEFYNTL